VIGGGITGALIAHALTQAGHRVVVADRRYIGWGSTSASTALLQYEIDTHLTELSDMIGEPAAALAYQSCRDAIRKTQRLCEQVDAGHFTAKKSFYFASRKRDVKALQLEFMARERHGLAVEWWDQARISQQFDLKAEAAILSHDAAEIDAYHLTHGLHQAAINQGQRVFERTEITAIEPAASHVTVRTADGQTITAQHVAIACGYESLSYVNERVADLNSTYALVSEPVKSFDGWYERCLMWESARPYIYARTTSDQRIIFGGEDIPFRNPLARDRLMASKAARLEKRWQELFPRIPLETAFYWSGTFAETKDGLPYVGFHPDHPRQFFAMCFGGNGITFSVLAAEMMVAALAGEQHACAPLFRFGR
ncbi:MAG TPA: FAD-dependent oxidoreductase, partial [Pirellulaceae bacterium]|nr:FAD-dependent oxidoreductase [Pirellulaceae bacterium]